MHHDFCATLINELEGVTTSIKTILGAHEGAQRNIKGDIAFPAFPKNDLNLRGKKHPVIIISMS